MQTTVNLPDGLFEKSAAIAAARGATIEELIIDAIAREIGSLDPRPSCGSGRVDLPLIRSQQPGTLDLSDFNFDDLLA